jgi:hypothetical protein
MLFRGRATKGSLDEAILMPCHTIYVHWGFGSSADTLEWHLTINVDPGSSVGEYLALFSGSIDGSPCYLGLQTNVSHPAKGRGIGKGLIFSTWSSFDESDTRLAADGFRELGTHEGTFIGVRKPYRWSTGDYRITLSRSDTEMVGGRAMDWFDLSIRHLGENVIAGVDAPESGRGDSIGGLRFCRRNPAEAAQIDPGGLLFLEVYSGARTWADVAPWHLDVMAYADGARCPAGRFEYPRYPHGQQMPNANARYDVSRGRAELKFGTGVVKEDPPRRWP